MTDIEKKLQTTSYPGRGILLGRSADAGKAVIAYFIMGRSANSRNRIFVEDGEGIRTQAFDPAKMEDPSLIIYAPVRVLGSTTIVTNGDQTDTIFDGMEKGLTFEQSLRCRTFEPDGPNFTPRISGIVDVKDGAMSYSISILKSACGDPESVLRYTFDYENPKKGEGRFISTYQGDGNPLPSFVMEISSCLPSASRSNLNFLSLSPEVWALVLMISGSKRLSRGDDMAMNVSRSFFLDMLTSTSTLISLPSSVCTFPDAV